MEKIRVALMTSTVDGRPAKGTAIVARKCIEVLLARRDQFDLTFIHYEKSDDSIYAHGIREIILPTFRWGFLNRRLLRFMWYMLTTKDEFDIMQWFQPRLYPLFFLAPARHIVVFVHGAGDVAPGKRFNLMRELFNWNIKVFKRYVSVAIAGSAYARADIIKHYHFDPGQVRVINNGVDQSFTRADETKIAQVRAAYGLPEKFFLGVGRLILIKNVLRTLQAFELFCKESGDTNTHFVNIGAVGPERSSIDEFLAKTPYRDRIRLIEYVEQDDLPAVYSAAFALVFPILNEGFGLPAIEAMACGTPAIISETALPEITAEDAVLVDPMDIGSIANGMRALAEDAAFSRKMQAGGCAKAATFTWEETGKKLVAIYESLMGGRPRSL